VNTTTVKSTDTVRIVAIANPDNLLVQVWDDDKWRTATTADTYENARPFANLAHNVLRRGGDAADAIIAILTMRAEETCRIYAGFDMGEAVWGGVNTHLGMCPDGCCGGPEVLDDSEIPAWVAYRKRLTDAVKRSGVTA
jgi:hypothetical protein